jgi:hypothetical protein
MGKNAVEVQEVVASVAIKVLTNEDMHYKNLMNVVIKILNM